MWPAAHAVLSHRLTRRGVLGAGLLFGATAIGLGGLSYTLFRGRAAAQGRALLSDEEAKVVAAIADTYFPPGNELGVAAQDVDVVGGVDAYLNGLLPREKALLRGVVMAFDAWPRLSFTSSARFSDLPLDDRVAILSAWEDSALDERRQLVSVLRVIVGMVVFDDPRFLAAIGHRWGCPIPLPVLQ